MKPGGASGYRQPVELESRELVPAQTKLALVRNGVEEPLTPREDATLNARGIECTIDAPMVFVGYGLSIPEGWDDLAGLDLRGKVAVFVNALAPADVPDNVRSHVGSGPERWAALKRAGAIGVAALPGSLAAPETPRDGASTTLVVGGGARLSRPSSLPIRSCRKSAGQIVGLTVTRRGAEKLFAGSGHTVDELDKLISDGSCSHAFRSSARSARRLR